MSNGYSEARVDYTPEQHANARKMDGFFHSVDDALDDGFQPIQDIAAIAPGAWDVIDLTRTIIAELTATLGRRPTSGEVAHEFATYAQMLDRDNGWTAQLAAGTPGEPPQ